MHVELWLAKLWLKFLNWETNLQSKTIAFLPSQRRGTERHHRSEARRCNKCYRWMVYSMNNRRELPSVSNKVLLIRFAQRYEWVEFRKPDSRVARLALRTWMEAPIVCRINHWLWDLFLSHLSTGLATVLMCFARNSRIYYVVLSLAKFRQFKCSSDLFCLLSTLFSLFAPIGASRGITMKMQNVPNMIIKLKSEIKCAPPKFIIIIHYAKW